MCSGVAQLSSMNKKRVDRDMATLVMIFQNLIKLPSQGSLINEGAPTPFCPSSLVKAFIESFPCKGAAQLCFKDAILLAESFDINQLLRHEASVRVRVIRCHFKWPRRDIGVIEVVFRSFLVL